MARRPKSREPEQTPPSVSPAKGIEIVQRQVDAGKKLVGNTISEHEFDAWTDLSEQCVIRAFGRNSDRHFSFQNAGPWVGFSVSGYGDDPRSEQTDRRDRLKDRFANLESSIEVLKLDIELAAAPNSIPVGTASEQSVNDQKVFIVHGHDHAALQSVARYVERLGLAPVVLHEQPNKGRTVIEKLIDHSRVGFAVILLTPDDVGRSVSQTAAEEQRRSRQNVILELGYFLGAIGRERVCALYVAGVEIPSDYIGTAYTQLDDGGAWKLTLARELKTAGFTIDLNKAF